MSFTSASLSSRLQTAFAISHMREWYWAGVQLVRVYRSPIQLTTDQGVGYSDHQSKIQQITDSGGADQ